MPGWVKALLDEWIQAANLNAGRLFRRVNKNGKAWGDGLTAKAVWHVARENARISECETSAGKAGIERLAPHDLRRTCARLCHAAGGELEQIQFLLGHVSIQTTERYLGCKQRIRAPLTTGSELNSRAEAATRYVLFADNTGAEWVWCHPLVLAWYRELAPLESVPT